MKRGKFYPVKLILIASVLLNLAFIGGFTIKKIRTSHKHKAISQHMQHDPGEKDQAGACIRHLCKHDPVFKKIFEEHKSYCNNRCNDLVKMKIKLLTQLKNNQIEPELHEELNHQIHKLTHELHDRNHRHLMLLKQHLNPKEFAKLIDHMIDVLGKQHLGSSEAKPINININKKH